MFATFLKCKIRSVFINIFSVFTAFFSSGRDLSCFNVEALLNLDPMHFPPAQLMLCDCVSYF